jgi:hypothetical protein
MALSINFLHNFLLLIAFRAALCGLFLELSKENETSVDFWDFGGTRITVPSKVPFILIAHAWPRVCK